MDIRIKGMVAFAALLAGPVAAHATEDIVFGTNWKAEAEHGGFYQAVAEGIYERHGLHVTIRQGGPQVNHAALVAAGKLDFYMGGNLFGQFNFTQGGVPVTTVAAFFQKEPQVLLVHPDAGIDSFEDLKDKTLLIGNDGRLTFFLWMQQEFGLSEDQIKPYTFNPAPFIADPDSAQQGYITSEPFAVEQQAGWKPGLLVMADAGYDTYSTTIVAQNALIDGEPDVVQAFIDASIEGWISYLYGDPSPGNKLIKADNPDMTDEQIAYSIAAMKEHGIVDSGDSLEMGIGAMTDERWKSFFDKAVSWGVYPADLDYMSGYTLKFVNKGVGLEQKKKLLGH
ncbi:MAG: ABC transporter substrate-binding protein [Geminicoccaceae bacterium]|nr:ABC transporter substrate-binding protein [Geminicoccaceae bacterium]MCB9943624.1 ABC transporter substrate-binding protein [Geminicoccaceae bacterium]